MHHRGLEWSHGTPSAKRKGQAYGRVEKDMDIIRDLQWIAREGERLDGIEIRLGHPVYPAVCLLFFALPVGYDASVPTPGLHGGCALDTGGKGQKVGEYGRLHVWLVVLDPGSTTTVQRSVVV